jgi:hypothetical protein
MADRVSLCAAERAGRVILGSFQVSGTLCAGLYASCVAESPCRYGLGSAVVSQLVSHSPAADALVPARAMIDSA